MKRCPVYPCELEDGHESTHMKVGVDFDSALSLIERGRHEERAHIVAWLRWVGTEGCCGECSVCLVYRAIVDRLAKYDDHKPRPTPATNPEPRK